MDLGVDIRHGHQFVGLAQEGDMITGTIKDINGRLMKSRRSTFLVPMVVKVRFDRPLECLAAAMVTSTRQKAFYFEQMHWRHTRSEALRNSSLISLI